MKGQWPLADLQVDAVLDRRRLEHLSSWPHNCLDETFVNNNVGIGHRLQKLVARVIMPTKSPHDL